MQSTLPLSASATSSAAACTPSPQLPVSPGALLAAFSTIPDPRGRQGTRFPLPAILALAVAAILTNHLSILAIAEWGADQCHELLRLLGFPKGVTPHQSTLQRLFARLDPDQLSGALSNYFTPSTATAQLPRASQAVAIDGKAQRGRLAFGSSGCPVHALIAYLHQQGVVLAQEPIDKDEQTDKAEAELTVAPKLVRRVNWRGRVLTGDALFCQRQLCQQVLDAGGDYLLLVKQNQPALYEDIRLLFDPPSPTLPLDDQREATTVEHGHGRHKETGHLIASTDLVGYSDWPGLGQVFRWERTWQERGQSSQEVHYGITSLPPQIADAGQLLELKRGHWEIENGLHYAKDVTLGEDRSLVHVGQGPSIMGMLRDLCLSLLHQVGCRTIARRLRYHSRHPQEVVALIINNHFQNA